MTEEEQLRIQASIDAVSQAVAQLHNWRVIPIGDLYQDFQALHTTALAPWCELCDILQSNIQPRTERSEADAINLEELFGDGKP